MHRLLLISFLILSACAVRVGEDAADEDRFPTSRSYAPDVMSRVSVTAAGETPWKLSALETPRATPAPWKIVVVTGTPSWSEYWAPVLAQTPATREMVVADRPGFAMSEPQDAVTDINAQADALAALLAGPPEQKVVLIGQSYGGPIATVLAARHPGKVRALVLMSAFYGERGPTIRRLDALGSMMRPALPRDMKNSLAEIGAQAPQLPKVREALASLSIPVIVLHGDRDTFIMPVAAERLAAEARAEYVVAPGGDHFLNACCVPAVLDAVERAIAKADQASRPSGD